MEYTLEVIAFSIQSCQIAKNLSVQRIELCDNVADGGTTASAGFISMARKEYPGELYPIIRPRGGDFLYSDAEFDIMQRDILYCKSEGCDGVVLGLLTKDAEVDFVRTEKLVSLAYPMGVCFHRAFDRVGDPFRAMEQLIQLGVERILTSGLQPTAFEGIPLIKQLIHAAKDRIEIMPGSGIRAENVLAIATSTGARALHSSAKTYEPTAMNYLNPQLKETLQYPTLDQEEILSMMKILQINQ